jgi:hypothetical protein
LAGPVTEYFRGIASVMWLGYVGAYGGYRSIKFLFDQGLITWGHQAFAWSRGADGKIMWDLRAHLQQYAAERSMCGTDGDVDFNRGMFADFGQWPAPTQPEPALPNIPTSHVTIPTFLAGASNGKLDIGWNRLHRPLPQL